LKTNVGHLTKTGQLMKYFCIDIKSNVVCLICRESVASFQEYNLKRHFQMKHDNFGKNLSETKLRGKADDMVRNLEQEQTTFTKPLSVQEAATKVSFVIAHKIVKNNKPFVEEEFIKECILN
jgi:Spin-doc zinc-finger